MINASTLGYSVRSHVMQLMCKLFGTLFKLQCCLFSMFSDTVFGVLTSALQAPCCCTNPRLSNPPLLQLQQVPTQQLQGQLWQQQLSAARTMLSASQAATSSAAAAHLQDRQLQQHKQGSSRC